MIIKYNVDFDNEAIKTNLTRLINQVYKLLPSWEEAADWRKPLSTIIIEFAGMSELLVEHQILLFPLLCKLEGLSQFSDEQDFLLFRKTIFECLNLINDLIKKL